MSSKGFITPTSVLGTCDTQCSITVAAQEMFVEKMNLFWAFKAFAIPYIWILKICIMYLYFPIPFEKSIFHFFESLFCFENIFFCFFLPCHFPLNFSQGFSSLIFLTQENILLLFKC